MKKNLSIILIILLLVIPIFAMGAKSNISYFEREVGKIEVEGYAKFVKKADIIDIKIKVENIAKSSAEAQNNVNKSFNNMVSKLLDLDIDKDSIITNNISLRPNRVWHKDEYIQKGYKAIQTISIKLDFDKERVAKAMDIFTQDNAISINYISYDLKDKENYLRNLRKEAVKNAYEKASDYALASNSKIDRVLFITEKLNSDYNPNYRELKVAGASYDNGSDNAPTNVYPSDITLSKRIKVIYSIESMQ